MKTTFKSFLKEDTFPTDRGEIIDELDYLNIDIKKCTIHPNGVVDVHGSVHISKGTLTKLPLQFGKVTGNFICNENHLTTLKGSPTEVTGIFNCEKNYLTSLEFCPTSVMMCFNCSYNELTSLKYAPDRASIFNCEYNNLTSLQYAPAFISNAFVGSNKNITSLEGISDIFTTHLKAFYNLDYPISRGGLGLILIPGLTTAMIKFADSRVGTIINKYLGRPNDIFDCQNELIEAGLEEYAVL